MTGNYSPSPPAGARLVGVVVATGHRKMAAVLAGLAQAGVRLATAVLELYQTVGYLERGEYSPSLQLALRLAGFFGLPVEAIFSLAPFNPLSEQLYRGGPTAAAREASA